jgi:membrane fusion protein (multidrug efflux system)
VDEQDLAPVRPGGAVVLSAPGYPDRVFQGAVERVGAQAVPQTEVRTGTRIVRVRISLDPTPPAERALLKPGMQVHVRGSAVLSPRATLVPNDAVLTDAQGSYVFVVTQDRAHRRSVQTGFATGRETEILTGLRVGEQVVVSGKEAINEGVRVAAERTP